MEKTNTIDSRADAPLHSHAIDIDIHHLTRVEGHGNILVNVSDGKIEKCEWQVPEAPRFFEAMVRGRHYTEVARVTSRICGICSVGHSLVSCKATEQALGLKISEQTKKLRKLLKDAENFDSHIVHVLFLAAPDLFGAPSVFPLIPTHEDVIRRALRLKQFGHEWGSVIAGRTTHPNRIVPGGFSELPGIQALAELRDKFTETILPDLDVILETVLSVAYKFPRFERETEYIALHSDDEYALYDGVIQSVLPNGEKEQYTTDKYKSVTNEFITPSSTAKYARNKLDSYMVGALARFNNNFSQLNAEAHKVASYLNMKAPCFHPYLNTAAQLIEIVHSAHEGIRLLDEFLSTGLKEEELPEPVTFGEGVGAIEVPRGILFHHYKYDHNYICQGGNCVIPTNQNHNNIQLDFDALLPELLEDKKTQPEIELALEMLVRAYDPCISCSTHHLSVKYT